MYSESDAEFVTSRSTSSESESVTGSSNYRRAKRVRTTKVTPTRNTSIKQEKTLPGNGNTSDEEVESKLSQRNGKVVRTRRKPRAAQHDPSRNTLFLDGFEGYFDQHKQREKISDTPFSRAPTLENSSYVRLVAELTPQLKSAQQNLTAVHGQYFNQWALELEEGHNLVLFGIGSKRRLVFDFISWWDPPLSVVVANGYNPGTSFKEVLNAVVGVLVDREESDTWFKTPSERLLLLEKHLESTQKRCILVVNSVDGNTLRDDRNRPFMSRLLALPQLLVVCTVDNINAPAIWTPAEQTAMRLVWHHATTFDQMTAETAYLDILGLGKSRTAVQAQGVRKVLDSLTANARALYKLLVTLQYEEMLMQKVESTVPGSAQFGIEAGKLYERCVAEFVASNERNFHVMLAEFLEHHMVDKVRQGTTEVVYVPYTLDDIEQIMAEM